MDCTNIQKLIIFHSTHTFSKLVWQSQYIFMDFMSFDVFCELKTLRTGNLCDSACIDLLSVGEYDMFKTALEENPNALCFMFLYFAKFNKFYHLKISLTSPFTSSTNIYGKQCYIIESAYKKTKTK